MFVHARQQSYKGKISSSCQGVNVSENADLVLILPQHYPRQSAMNGLLQLVRFVSQKSFLLSWRCHSGFEVLPWLPCAVCLSYFFLVGKHWYAFFLSRKSWFILSAVFFILTSLSLAWYTGRHVFPTFWKDSPPVSLGLWQEAWFFSHPHMPTVSCRLW